MREIVTAVRVVGNKEGEGNMVMAMVTIMAGKLRQRQQRGQ
jgi:hypothetical protein